MAELGYGVGGRRPPRRPRDWELRRYPPPGAQRTAPRASRLPWVLLTAVSLGVAAAPLVVRIQLDPDPLVLAAAKAAEVAAGDPAKVAAGDPAKVASAPARPPAADAIRAELLPFLETYLKLQGLSYSRGDATLLEGVAEASQIAAVQRKIDAAAASGVRFDPTLRTLRLESSEIEASDSRDGSVLRVTTFESWWLVYRSIESGSPKYPSSSVAVHGEYRIRRQFGGFVVASSEFRRATADEIPGGASE